MRLLKVVLAATAACVALGVVDIIASGPAQADPVTQEATASAFNGVWAPQGRGPGGPGGRGPGGGPRFEANANGDVTVSIGAGPVGERPQGGPGGFRGPPPGGPGFGPPPGGPGERGPGMIQISEEDRAKGLEQGDVRTRAQMTEAGKAKFATFDPLLHPTSNCRTPGLPSIAQIPELQEWSIGDAGLVIRHESYEAKRTVHFDQTSHPNEAHTTLGHAIGRLDGDTLTIETANLSEEWGGLGRNAPGSDARVVRETYRLVDRDTIEGQIEITDPKFLTRTLRMPVTLKRQPAGTEIVDFPCEVEVAQRDYKYIADGLARSPPAPAP